MGQSKMNAQSDFMSAYQDGIPNYRNSNESISSLGVFETKVRVYQPRSAWIEELESKFNSLTSLRKGWDGYNGVPVSFTCAQFAAHLIERLYTDTLPAPQLVPVSDGTLRLEWHLNEYDVEIDVLGTYDILAYRLDLVSDKEEEIEVETDFTTIANWIADLGRVRDQQFQRVGG